MHHSFQEFVVDAADLYANQTKWVYLFSLLPKPVML